MAEKEILTCERCSLIFTPANSEEEVKDEFKQLFGREPNSDDVMVCDDCFQELTKGLLN